MQTIHAKNPGAALRTGTGRRDTAVFVKTKSGIFGGNSNQMAGPAAGRISGMDTFQISGNISKLLSPACGMTEEEKSTYMARIRAKLKSGKKLTAEEMRFLQAEDPVLYQQAARVQAMRDSLENQLKGATSKKNAEEIYSTNMSLIPDNDPMKEYIIAAYDDVMKEFKASDEYKALPEKDEKK